MGESGSVEQETISPLEYLDKLCDYALSIGMSYEDYWYNHYDILIRYHNAEIIRQKRKNNEMWLQGAYVYQAIGSLAPVLNSMSKDHKAKKYLERPIPITKEEIEEQEAKKLQRFVNFMDSLTTKKYNG